MKYSYKTFTHIGLKRVNNEDAFGAFEVEGGLLAIVCDGLGGSKAGDIASKLTVEVILNTFSGSAEDDYLERIKHSISAAGEALTARSAGNKSLEGMATTVEVIFLKDSSAYWGHIGDSRIYNLRNKKLKQLTKDHSLVQKLVDEGLLTLKEAENHPNRNIIMRALGDNSKAEADLSKLKLSSREDIIFFICTDGVSGVINDAELEMLLNTYGEDNGRLSEKLTEIILERGAPDNFTFIIINKTE